MQIITRRHDIDQLTLSGALDPIFAAGLTAEWLALAEGVLGGDEPEENEDLSESMTTVVLEPGDDWTKISLLPCIPNHYRDGIPWDDAEKVDLEDGRSLYFGHSVCSDWHVLVVFQESPAVPEAFANWFSSDGDEND